MAVGLNMEIGEVMGFAFDIAPSDLHGQANTGLWCYASGFRTGILFLKNVGTASQDPVLTFQQATDNLGTNAKALNITRYRVMSSASLSQTTMTQLAVATQAAANTVTLTGLAALYCLALFEIKEFDLDINNGFNHVQCSIANVGANAQIGSVTYLAFGNDFLQAVPPNFLN